MVGVEFLKTVYVNPMPNILLPNSKIKIRLRNYSLINNAQYTVRENTDGTVILSRATMP